MQYFRKGDDLGSRTNHQWVGGKAPSGRLRAKPSQNKSGAQSRQKLNNFVHLRSTATLPPILHTFLNFTRFVSGDRQIIRKAI